MRDEGLEAVAVVPGSNMAYLTGLDLPFYERPTVLVVSQGLKPLIVLPSLEFESWQDSSVSADVITWRDEAGFQPAFDELSTRIQANVIGVEGMRMRVFEFLGLQSAFPHASISNAQSLFSRLRLQKDDTEIASLRMAISSAESALEKAVAEVRLGMTEVEIQALLISKIIATPGVKLEVDPLVLAGSNAARPHGHARKDYEVKSGDPLLIDFGITCRGYWSDITRTFFIKDVTKEHREFYNVVRTANEVGRQNVRPGTTAHAIDDAVQTHLESSAYAAYIVHKTGHGIGLEVHEGPQIMRGNHAPIAENMVFTIEPGLYRPGDIGVRIEDDVLVTRDGAESLSKFPRELIVVG
jgi:Xaa-Pro dipeptidase